MAGSGLMGRSRLLQPLQWYQWNPSQWQGSRKVQRMGWAARGLYRELMDECWLKGSVPSTVFGVANLFEADEDEIAFLLPQIIRCFDVASDGTMTSPFIEDIRTEIDARRVIQAERRLGKDKHGNPRLTPDSKSEPQLSDANQSYLEREREREREVPSKVPSRTRKSRKASGDAEVIGDYPPEVSEAISIWRDLLKTLRTPDLQEQFPMDKRFLPASVGTMETTWRAWEKYLLKSVRGNRVTNPDVLAAVRIWADEKLRRARAGIALAAPMLPTMINHPDFVDAVVRSTETRMAREVSNAS